MKHLQKLYEQLCLEEQQHANEIFNYTIPESWNLYGYTDGIPTNNREIIVHPYAFTKFTLEHILHEQPANLKKDDWYQESVIYYQITRLTTAWNHTRTKQLKSKNLYQLNDHGTFLKAILRLPFYRRIGINTIMLNAPFSLSNNSSHTFAHPYAIHDFMTLDETLKDPLIKNLTIKEEYQAFEECAHHLGFHIIWQLDISTMGRDNACIKEHPEWFYWIDKAQLFHMHSPTIPYLSKNCLPDKELLSLLHQNEDVIQQNAYFHDAPKTGLTLLEIEASQSLTTVPFMHDRMNSVQPVEYDYTPLRFYTDTNYTQPDILRVDMYPGKKRNQSLWQYLQQALRNLQKEYVIDGFFFTRCYLLPNDLLMKLIKIAKDHQQIVILEDTQASLPQKDTSLIDGISGDSAYVEHDVWNHQLHNFAYRLKEHAIPIFAGAEFLDSPRITQYNNPNLISLLHVLNQFLPNSIPLYMSGMECAERQPLLLSYFQDQSYRFPLDQNDPRFMKQPMIDEFYFNYQNDAMYNQTQLLERVSILRSKYVEAITHKERCIPLWFDSPDDPGIGFAYQKGTNILAVIANTNVDQPITLHTHLQNIYTQNERELINIQQVFSTKDPFTYDISEEEFHIVHLFFEPGEIKFLELTFA